MRGVGEGDDARGVHFVEADMEADGAGHQQVVVVSVYGAVSAVWFAFVGEVFVKAADVALGIEAFANDLNES